MIFGHQRKRAQEVFGVTPEILPDSYVDRGQLDEELQRLLGRSKHIALRGESKCGKSWLRQKVIADPLVVQCRLGKTSVDIYRDALALLGVKLEIKRTETGSFTGRAEFEGEMAIKLFAKVRGKLGAEGTEEVAKTTEPVGRDFTDLNFIADVLKASGKRLVIEDFHYLSIAERAALAFDLKALWDYHVYVVIVGVWSKQNMLLSLNPDLSGRVEEVAIVWTAEDLGKVFAQGGRALNVNFGADLQERAIHDCFENVGLLQTLILGTLDVVGIDLEQDEEMEIADIGALDDAAMLYAEQLNPIYLRFADQVSGGIRKRSDSTGIYAHAMAAILESEDDELIRGLSLDRIFEVTNEREPRIQKGNLKTVLKKFEGLQVDKDGRGLVLAYNEVTREISVVDRQLLLYRKYATVGWPWEEMIEASKQSGDTFEADDDS
jgi:hypothetical protein